MGVALFRPLGSIRALGRPISPVGLNTGSGSPYFARWAQYGLRVALLAAPIRAPGGYCPLGNTPPSRGSATLTLGCVLAPADVHFPAPFMERGGGDRPGERSNSPTPFMESRGRGHVAVVPSGLQLCRDLLCSILIFCTCVSLCCPKIATIEAQVVVVSTIRITLV